MYRIYEYLYIFIHIDATEIMKIIIPSGLKDPLSLSVDQPGRLRIWARDRV